MSFCIILHGGLAPHINTTWTTRSWWRFCQVTEDYAHTMISFKLLSSVPACSILKISIIYIYDKHWQVRCVCVCGYCMCFVHSHPHPCNHHQPPTNSPDRVHGATGSSDPSLGVLPVEAANEKSRSLRVSKRSHISKVSNIQLSTNCNHQEKKKIGPKKKGNSLSCFLFHKLLEMLSGSPPQLGSELVPSFPDSAGQGAMRHVLLKRPWPRTTSLNGKLRQQHTKNSGSHWKIWSYSFKNIIIIWKNHIIRNSR